MMEGLAEEDHIDRARLDRWLLEIAEPVFQIGVAVFCRDACTVFDHLGRVIDRNDLLSGAGQ